MIIRNARIDHGDACLGERPAVNQYRGEEVAELRGEAFASICSRKSWSANRLLKPSSVQLHEPR